MKTSAQIRKTFLEYFKDKGHAVAESSSLVPIDDPTLLFANAGMNQFKDVFLGVDRRNYSRAATAQKCVRAGGKHNDLDTVGRTARHHTFFEMLGNFSFGDYFKREAIEYAWEFLTDVVQLPREKLWITIFQDDDEAYKLWQEVAGVSPDRIIRMGEKDNFWAMGDTGPCGPCSEIHYDRGESLACYAENCGIGRCECDRWLEVWNLVFMQFNRDEDGSMTPLPKPSIDTGMGLERLTSIIQGVESNFDTDLFIPIMKHIENLTGKEYHRGEAGFPFRVIADHTRACTFLIADGVLPGNEGRGYVLRRILRRAVRFGRMLGIQDAFLYKGVDVVCDIMKDAYPQLEEKKEFIKKVIKLDEERFMATLNEGLKKVEEIINEKKSRGGDTISGAEAFMLYDTYGFPLDSTEDVAEENNLKVDRDGFNLMMEEQRERARKAGKAEGLFAREIMISDLLTAQNTGPTVFTGYDNLEESAAILALIKDGQLFDTVEGGPVLLVVEATPFYAESGGQVADKGVIRGAKGRLQVEEVQKVGEWIVHLGIVDGVLNIGEKVELKVDAENRMDTARNHTATHLLHKALRTVLGEHAQQKGSLVEAERLRFDFSHLAALSAEELLAIEKMVNAAIRDVYQVSTRITDIDSAREIGATALFGEKYSEQVRIVMIDDYSKELCGGTHVDNTGKIGCFKILSEGSIGSGLRRIEAITGRYVMHYLFEVERELNQAASILRTSVNEVSHRIEVLNKALKEKDKEIEGLKSRIYQAHSEDLINKAYKIGDANILIERIEPRDAESLRQHAEMLKDKLSPSVVMLASVNGDKVLLVCFVSQGLIAKGLHAGKLAGAAAKIAGGGGGGRPDMAQAGARDASKLKQALAMARSMVEKTLS